MNNTLQVSKITKSIPIPVFYAFQNKPNYKPHSWGNPASNSKKKKAKLTGIICRIFGIDCQMIVFIVSWFCCLFVLLGLTKKNHRKKGKNWNVSVTISLWSDRASPLHKPMEKTLPPLEPLHEGCQFFMTFVLNISFLFLFIFLPKLHSGIGTWRTILPCKIKVIEL